MDKSLSQQILPFGIFCKRAISSTVNLCEDDSTLLFESELNFITLRIFTSSSNLEGTSGVIAVDELVLSDKDENSFTR